MLKVETILVPTDFSASSEAAARKAEEVASAFGADLVYLHVVPRRSLTLVDVAGYVPTYELDDLELVGGEMLAEWATRSEQLGLRVHQRLTRGFPKEDILAAATKCEADLIVMGTHGRTGVRHAFLGSVAEGVVRSSPVPVMIVRAPTLA